MVLVSQNAQLLLYLVLIALIMLDIGIALQLDASTSSELASWYRDGWKEGLNKLRNGLFACNSITVINVIELILITCKKLCSPTGCESCYIT